MKQLIAFAFVILTWSVTAQSLDLPSISLEELTWTEVKAAIDKEYKTIIIPTGGTEQNGPHMVLGKHNVRIKYMAEKIALELGDALVAPVVAYVPEGGIEPPRSHMRFPGTIHLSEEYFMKLLEYASKSFAKHGFTDIVLIGDSGPNQNGMKLVAQQLNAKWRETNVRVHFVNDFYLALNEVILTDILQENGIPKEAIGRHAGLWDVSYSLAIDSNLVRKEMITALSNNANKNYSLGFSGDPSLASKDIGDTIVKAKIKASVSQIKLLKKESRK